MSEAAPLGETCRNCGHAPVGNFCPQCGQRRMDDAQRRLPHLLAQFFEAATDLDSRFWRSIKALVLHPGRLSREYIDGRRARWLGPMALFLLVNIVYFVFSPVSDLNLGLQEQMHYQPYSDWVRERVTERNEARGVALETYAESYRQVVGDVAKSLVIWHVPWLALLWMLLFIDRRLYYAEHFVAALHACAFIMAAALLLLWLAQPPLALAQQHMGWPAPGRILSLLLSLMVLSSFYGIARSVYRVAHWRAALSVPVMLFALLLAHLNYRFVQFLVVFALT